MKEKRIKLLLLVSILFMPLLVYARETDNPFPIGVALFMEAFVSIHMSFFVLKPLAEIISPNNHKKVFWILFAIRAGILLYCDFFVTTNIAMVDFFAVFVGAFTVLPTYSVVNMVRSKKLQQTVPTSNLPAAATPMTITSYNCDHCHTPLKPTDKFCPNCGAPFDISKVAPPTSDTYVCPKCKKVLNSANAFCPDCGTPNPNTPAVSTPTGRATIYPRDFDPIYSFSEDAMVHAFLMKEMKNAGIDTSSKLIPRDILHRKKFLNAIFAFLLFIYICLIFIHFPIYTYIIGAILLIIFFFLTRKYNLVKFLTKQIKARPSEKISNIVMNVKTSFVEDNSKVPFVLGLLVALLIPNFLFYKPQIIYEKVESGYAVRYYIFGISNFTTATIPDTYKGEPVVSLRGNTFSNMPYLKRVTLPETVTEIRGQAFKNCYHLEEVNIPPQLEYLGGGAFYNCKKLTSVEFPDTLSYLGGESFYGASSLESVSLPAFLPEIRGDTFEYCTSLRSITIPDSVTRIGGHAFYGDTALYEVIFTENSQLNEIGSSAFRQCTALYEITIPKDTYVNMRAFKESPTTIHRFGETTNNYNNYYDYEYSFGTDYRNAY